MTVMGDQRGGGFAWRERPGAAGAPVLVCLHGIGSNAGAFDALVPHLPADWRVIAWDAPGYGDSRPLVPDWPLAADYAGALAQFAGRLGLGRFRLLGHSLGTLIGAAFASRHPGRVERLTLAA
jgi:pimeloyl-ACP methyl ester carboxylesterase